jgi:hypothetical protein
MTAIRVRFQGGAGDAGGMWLSLVLGGAASVAVALAVSAAVSTPDRAVFAAPLLMLPQILFSGLLAPIDDLGPAKVLADLVTARWTYEAIGRVAGVARLAHVPPQFSQAGTLGGNASTSWLVLVGFVAAFGVVAVGLQKLKDRR